MNSNERMSDLVAQAAGSGVDPVVLRILIEEASELGARRVLQSLGLEDEQARRDLSELRQLLDAWRDAKTSALKATVDWLVRGVLALLLIAIAWRLGVAELLR